MVYNTHIQSEQALQRDLTEVNDTVPALRVTELGFSEILLDPVANPIYIGINPTNLATSSTGWTIYKLVYSGSNISSIKQVKGIWDDRTGLF